MKSLTNKWLIVRPSVVLTDIIDPVIAQLDEWFGEQQLNAIVTSGLRDPLSQLAIIKDLAVVKHPEVAVEFPEIHNASLQGVTTAELSGKMHTVYYWQRAWSRLLSKDIIVNPPLRATVLFDYFRDGINKRGMEIGGSPHFKGTAFDIGGGKNGIEDESRILSDALKSGKVKGFKAFLRERNNNANHCDCEKIV